jgi:hypothetical protein
MKKTLGEIFEQIATLSKTADKVAVIHQHDTTNLRYFLGLAHSSDVKWLLPEGAPPYTPDKAPLGYSPSNLNRELRTMYLFLEGVPSNLKPYRREQLFQQLLERLHSSEAELLLAVKDKKFGTKYKCSKAVVEAAYPGLLNNPFPVKLVR